MTPVSLDHVLDSSLFAGLSSDERESLADLFEVRQVAVGKTVFIENMTGENLYLINKGSVTISQMLGEIDEQSLVVLRSGETFGELALVDDELRAVTARVVDDAELYLLSRARFEELAAASPALGMKLMRNVLRTFSKRLRQAKSDYRDMLLATLESKKTTH